MHLDGVIEGPVAERALENLRSVLERDRLQAQHALAVDVAGRRARRRGHHRAREPRRRRRRVARARHPRGDRRDEGRPAHADRRGDRHRARHRVGVARPGGEPRSLPPARSGGIPRRHAQRRDAAHRTWVAGGVYRLVRREFRWGDAPTLAAQGAPRARRARRRCGSTRSSGACRARSGSPTSPAAASDLVGRDAEKADLHAAYHEAVSGNGGGGVVTTRAIVGELGIGKTALVGDVPRRAPAERAADPRRVLAGEAGGPVQRDRRAGARRDRHDGRGAVRGGRAAHRARRRRGGAGGRVEPDGRAPRRARDEPPGRARRRRRRALPEEARRERRARAARRDRAAAAARRRRRRPAVGRQVELRAARRDHPARPIRCRSCCSSSRARTIASATLLEGDRADRAAGARRPDEQVRLVETRLGVREGRARGVRGSDAARRRQPVLPPRDGRRAARARGARDPRDRRPTGELQPASSCGASARTGTARAG